MGLISVIWGIFALLWMLLAFIPLLGWGNWFMIPFAAVGAIIAAIAYALTSPQNRGRAKAGLILNLAAAVIGALRLTLGGGVI
ncbi:MAG: hypothetical protein QM612_07645 [Thermomonas sp.]|uniref:hypothetical protein n=1 Tax=Thermomonas sp. TaxID=1971895 RepID=UPI0039E2207E